MLGAPVGDLQLALAVGGCLLRRLRRGDELSDEHVNLEVPSGSETPNATHLRHRVTRGV